MIGDYFGREYSLSFSATMFTVILKARRERRAGIKRKMEAAQIMFTLFVPAGTIKAMKRFFQLNIVLVGTWLWVAAAQAADCNGVPIGTPGLNCAAGASNPIYGFLQFMINWIIRVLGAVAVLIIVSSPVFMVMSGGNPEGVKKAKSRLTNAVVGLILLSLSFVILKLIGVA